MRWTLSGGGMVAYGRFRHRVFRSYVGRGFYASTGLTSHGPYDTQAEAIGACEAREMEGLRP